MNSDNTVETYGKDLLHLMKERLLLTFWLLDLMSTRGTQDSETPSESKSKANETRNGVPKTWVSFSNRLSVLTYQHWDVVLVANELSSAKS